MITDVQSYISENGLAKLSEEFGITVKEYPNHIVLNYDQIKAKKGHPISDSCRALILYRRDLSVAFRSFKRFYNLGEMNTEIKDWSKQIVYEKADGSHIGLRFDLVTNQWEISTRGTAFAESNLMNNQKSFREAVIDAFGFADEDVFQKRCEKLDKEIFYVFEYCSPENLIVTKYDVPQMVLIGMFREHEEIFSVEHLAVEVCHLKAVGFSNCIRAPKSWQVDSREALEYIRDTELEDDDEGFVICHATNRERVKIKREVYLKLHRIRGNGNPTFKDIAELILTNEAEEFLAYFDFYRPQFEQVEMAVNKLLIEGEAIYEANKDIESQKDFAAMVKHHPLSSVMFTARNRGVGFRDAFFDSKLSYQVKVILENLDA